MEERSRKIQYLITSCLSVGSVAVGCYASWLAPVMPKFLDNETDIHVTNSEIAWMAAVSSPGFMAGSFFSRFTLDRFGRRATILGSVVPIIVGSVIIAFARKAWLLYISKFLWGAGTGFLNTAITIYLAEIADKEIRGSLSLITRFMFNFGNLLMMCIGPFVSYNTINYMLLAMPVFFIASYWWIPESPYYCLKDGKVDAARKVLLQLRGYKDEKILEDELLQMQADVRNEMRRSSSTKELFTGKQYRRAVIIVFGLKLTQIMTGNLVIQQYLGQILKESHTDLKLTTAFIIFGVVRFVVGVMSSVLADKVGRRPLLIWSYFGTFLSLGVVGIYFFIQEVVQIDPDILRPYGIITFIGLIAANIISTLGYNSIIVVVPAEIFPMNVKAVAMTSISIFGAMLNFFVARGYQIVKDLVGLCGVFWIFGGISLGGAIFSVLLVPETKGKSLREIQIELQGALYEDDETIKKLNQLTTNDVVIDSKELVELHKESNKLL